MKGHEALAITSGVRHHFVYRWLFFKRLRIIGTKFFHIPTRSLARYRSLSR